MFKTKKELNRGFLHEQFRKLWAELFQFHDNGPNADELIKSLKVLELSDLLRPEIILVYSLEKFEPLYVSDNAEKALGYSVEELLKAKSFFFFKLLAFQQIAAPIKVAKWVRAFWALEKDIVNHPKKMETYLGGIRSKSTNGLSKTFLMRNSYIVGPNYELPKNVVFYFTDITHLFRGNFYWVLFRSIGLFKSYTKLHISGGSKRESNNLITTREKEILIQFSEGKSNKEIGDFLKITTGTVEKHRRNMLEKTGARDTTALIHFCKLCKIL